MFELYITVLFIIIILSGVIASIVLLGPSQHSMKLLQNTYLIVGIISAIATLILQIGAIYWCFYAFLLPWDMDPPANIGRWQIKVHRFFDSGEPPFGPLFYFAGGFSVLFALNCGIYLIKDLFAPEQVFDKVKRVLLFTIINLLSLPLFVFVFFLCTMVPQSWVQQSRTLSYVDVLPGGLLLIALLIGVPWLHRKVSSQNNLASASNSELT